MKRVSLKTIANELGVSSATVSLVLNGKNKNGRVSEELSKKILDKAIELNYVPNTLAKGLKVGKSHTIGLIIADISNLFFGTLALHIQNFAQKEGYTVIIGNTNEREDEMARMIRFLYARQVDGLIITATEKSQHIIEDLTVRGIPLVLVDRVFPELDVNSVVINNYEVSYRATEQLIGKGCRNIGLVTYRQDHFHINERKRGCIDALRNAGIYNPQLIEEVSHSCLQEDIKRAIENLISNGRNLDGVFFTTNTISINGVRKLILNDVALQQEVHIVCFDENDAFHILPYSVPFIRQPIKEMGKAAVELLLDQIEMQTEEKRNIVLDAEFVLSGELVNKEQ